MPYVPEFQRRICRRDHGALLGVSTAGYYAWRDRPPSAHARADDALLMRIGPVHATSRRLYGRTTGPRSAPTLKLRADGEKHGRKRIARLMRAAGLLGACHRGSGPTTTRRDQDARPSPDRPSQSPVHDGGAIPIPSSASASFCFSPVGTYPWAVRNVRKSAWGRADNLAITAGISPAGTGLLNR